MSVNPDGMDTVDYSDFEYQQLYFRHEHTNLTGSPSNSVVNSEFDPLDGIGGLDTNEVAELVWLEMQVSLEHQQDADDQDVGSETQFFGVFGANIPDSTSLLPFQGTGGQTTVVQENNVTADSTGSEDSEDRVFAPYQITKTPAFDDQTNGPGGAGHPGTLVVQRPFRNMTGRGPVLDSSDSLTFLSSMNQRDEIIPANGKIEAHLVFDTAEVSDAGRAFSVPK